ncbi:hypothetical protein MHYP_G00145010 [Metynnis hypsauchen]
MNQVLTFRVKGTALGQRRQTEALTFDPCPAGSLSGVWDNDTDLNSDRRETADMRVRSNDTQQGSQPARQPNEPVEKLKRSR